MYMHTQTHKRMHNPPPTHTYFYTLSKELENASIVETGVVNEVWICFFFLFYIIYSLVQKAAILVYHIFSDWFLYCHIFQTPRISKWQTSWLFAQTPDVTNKKEKCILSHPLTASCLPYSLWTWPWLSPWQWWQSSAMVDNTKKADMQVWVTIFIDT